MHDKYFRHFKLIETPNNKNTRRWQKLFILNVIVLLTNLEVITFIGKIIQRISTHYLEFILCRNRNIRHCLNGRDLTMSHNLNIKMLRFKNLFPKKCSLLGMIHVNALPGNIF